MNYRVLAFSPIVSIWPFPSWKCASAAAAAAACWCMAHSRARLECPRGARALRAAVGSVNHRAPLFHRTHTHTIVCTTIYIYVLLYLLFALVSLSLFNTFTYYIRIYILSCCRRAHCSLTHTPFALKTMTASSRILYVFDTTIYTFWDCARCSLFLLCAMRAAHFSVYYIHRKHRRVVKAYRCIVIMLFLRENKRRKKNCVWEKGEIFRIKVFFPLLRLI